jgi:hypothetical protein
MKTDKFPDLPDDVDILSPVEKKVFEDVRLIFVGQDRPPSKYTTHYQVPTPEDLERKIINNLEMFYQEKPFKAKITVIVDVQHDS